MEILYLSIWSARKQNDCGRGGHGAAAATEVLMCDRGALLETELKELNFNEPFLYMLLDLETEIPLFIGILDNPLL